MAQSGDIGIDLGTSSILIYMQGKGVVLNEPSVMAIDRDSRRVLAIGSDAQRMLGRTPSNILAIQPLRQGVINDFELTGAMLHYLVQKVIGKRFFNRPRAVMAVPTGVNEIEKRSLMSIMLDASVRKTQLVEKTVAAAIGAKLSIHEAYGNMIVDIGAGVTDIAVISSSHIILSGMLKTGGDQFTEAIVRHLKRKHNLYIGNRSAEELKVNIGSVIPRADDIYMDVTGRSLLSGVPKTISISSGELTEAMDDPLQAFIEGLHRSLEETPAELVEDIYDKGITLSGGGAELSGLDIAIFEALKVKCFVAPDPQKTVVRGCGEVVENPREMNRFLDEKHRWNPVV
ncbi:MAG: rod shape-determining protein [Clostridia bacterium]|nr:rod shape-determining protein [Clostridia bacterium]